MVSAVPAPGGRSRPGWAPVPGHRVSPGLGWWRWLLRPSARGKPGLPLLRGLVRGRAVAWWVAGRLWGMPSGLAAWVGGSLWPRPCGPGLALSAPVCALGHLSRRVTVK